MSMSIFVYDSLAKPKPNTVFNRGHLDEKILKSSEDLNGDKDNWSGFARDLYKTFDDIIATGRTNDSRKIETYREDFANKYDFYHGGYVWYLFEAYMHDCGIEIAPWYIWNVIFHQIV